MEFNLVDRLYWPKKSRGVDWSRPVQVVARYGKKELWWIRGVTLSYSSICKEYVASRLELVPNASEEHAGHEYESKELFYGGRLSKARLREHADAIDKFFGVPGLAAQLDPRKTLVVEKVAFEQAWQDMPACVDVDPLRMKTLADLRWACKIQLDLIEEGQDGTEGDDVRAVRRWLKKYGSPVR